MNRPCNPEPELLPLLPSRFAYKAVAVVAIFAALTTTLSLSGRWFGRYLAQAGHTSSREIYDIFIGQDHLRLPANVIRLESQRTTRIAERVDLYLTWPGLEGYSKETRSLFDDVSRPESLIFLQIAQSTMSRDMSGRFDPVYRHILQDTPVAASGGLTKYEAKPDSSYAGEVFFTAERAGRRPYVLRCVLPELPAASTSADCQRDVHLGKDLTVLYRFSSRLLPQWHAIENSIESYITAHLLP
ncbi:hypothetical protein [Sinorhizobium medicae]|uniref:Transmembrane anchored protein n=2 Tax=Sinorhizobium medicae TaxID=110321 RepID=A6U8B4_SINMW|nr:hypothetical protein [Sinorhizobium medicae]ABR59894.1 conserved hypothetical protein [Sinorhizobium medicae WSM419]MBO1939941.1 hypothetical protein [Sinorhizobium medicae]MBO1962751.1 hypothetical protein [Sinorhizobium medicae]MDX0406272.1 hypothetical protein [Sinorhizobium medicae]MDX0412244.1 hypothetical protein [Sinorhizobium medicae]